MKEAKYTRKRSTIREVATGEVVRYKSINAAKAESWKIQMREDRQLGRGTVRVVD
jgi:hypothetical protein